MKDKIVPYGQIYTLNEGYVVELEVLNRLGLHLRPATLMAESSCKYVAEIRMFSIGNISGVDAKSIFNILMSGSIKGALLKFEAIGEGARESLDNLVGIFKDKFGEE
jgi:phosphotransferase system HPr (HPr) family protein